MITMLKAHIAERSKFKGRHLIGDGLWRVSKQKFILARATANNERADKRAQTHQSQ
jgi:hypothetical protein